MYDYLETDRVCYGKIVVEIIGLVTDLYKGELPVKSKVTLAVGFSPHCES